jgi:hypothetical protein
LRSGRQDDIVGTARSAGALLHSRGDRRTDLRIADDRRITGAVASQCLDRRVDDRLGGHLVGVADGQKNHIVTGLAAADALPVPSSGFFARDSVDKWRETHHKPLQ